MKKHFLFFLAAVAMVACQPVSISEEAPAVEENKTALVHVRVDDFDFLPFDTRASKTVGQVSTRLSYALFNLDGDKVMNTKSQQSTDEGYGKFELRLAPNQYILVTVAHNGAGNCTITSPTEVSFNNNLVTDTFTSCDTLDIEGGDNEITLKLVRRVGMVRLVLNEVLPQEVKQLKFYYTGGSSTLDASTGFGCKNSRQTVLLDVPSSAYENEGSIYEVYTLPHALQGELKMKISALNASGSTLVERNIDKLPVRVGEITQYKGALFGGSVGSNGMDVDFQVDDTDWTTVEYTF